MSLSPRTAYFWQEIIWITADFVLIRKLCKTILATSLWCSTCLGSLFWELVHSSLREHSHAIQFHRCQDSLEDQHASEQGGHHHSQLPFQPGQMLCPSQSFPTVNIPANPECQMPILEACLLGEMVFGRHQCEQEQTFYLWALMKQMATVPDTSIPWSEPHSFQGGSCRRCVGLIVPYVSGACVWAESILNNLNTQATNKTKFKSGRRLVLKLSSQIAFSNILHI